jgi:hypothetical protein
MNGIFSEVTGGAEGRVSILVSFIFAVFSPIKLDHETNSSFIFVFLSFPLV